MLSARNREALALSAALLALAGCGQREAAEPPPAREPMLMLTPDWIYTPSDEETRAATGPLTVLPGVVAAGPGRALTTGQGDRLDAVLWTTPAGRAAEAVAEVAGGLAGRPRARAQVFSVTGGNLCLGAQATHVVWYEPELIEGRTLALALLAGAPGETGSTVCRVLRYTRERSQAAAAAGGNEGSR